jgi:hypothetical protein
VEAAEDLRAASLSVLAALVSAHCGWAVSRQAVGERLNDGFGKLMEWLVGLGLGDVYRTLGGAQGGVFAAFGRILVEDSTVVSLPPHLAERWPGARNQSGKRQAAMKLQTLLELRTDSLVRIRRSPFTRNDQAAAADILEELRPGDLVLRDLGYFVLPVFGRIAAMGAYFLSRLHSGTVVLDPATGERLELLKLLRGRETLDLDVLLGCGERLPVRLVACRVPPDVAEERRREAGANRDRRCKPSASKLALLDWELFVTNVPRTVWSTRIAVQVYGLRWRIEILFKAWKSHLHLAALHAEASDIQAECLILARLLHAIRFQSSTWQVVRYTLAQHGRQASLLKTARLLTGPNGARLREALQGRADLLADILIRHCAHDRRRRISYAQAIEHYMSVPGEPFDVALLVCAQPGDLQVVTP